MYPQISLHLVMVTIVELKDTLFSSRRSIAPSSSQGRFVAARTKTSSSVFIRPSICTLIPVNLFYLFTFICLFHIEDTELYFIYTTKVGNMKVISLKYDTAWFHED